MGCNIQPENLHAAFSGREQAVQHFDGRGFSGAIRAEESVELARRNRQVHVFYGGEFSEPARETGGDDRIHRISTLTQGGGQLCAEISVLYSCGFSSSPLTRVRGAH